MSELIQGNKNKEDVVNSPSDYTVGSIETIDYIEDKLTAAGFEGYCVGNILKYLSRYRFKNGIEDLKKAQWYLNRLITYLEDDKENTRDLYMNKNHWS